MIKDVDQKQLWKGRRVYLIHNSSLWSVVIADKSKQEFKSSHPQPKAKREYIHECFIPCLIACPAPSSIPLLLHSPGPAFEMVWPRASTLTVKTIPYRRVHELNLIWIVPSDESLPSWFYICQIYGLNDPTQALHSDKSSSISNKQIMCQVNITNSVLSCTLRPAY